MSKYKSVQNLWKESLKSLKENQCLNIKMLEDFSNQKYRLNLRQDLNFIKKHRIRIIKYSDNNYPIKLNFIKNKPIVLYAIGNLEGINNESVAIVGSRNCSAYGKRTAEMCTIALAQKGINIVSGLANGIDSIAHKSCLDTGGKTIAVIGTGLDRIYPEENLGLARRILKHEGLILSEYPIGINPDGENFPRRNRIISGLSNAVLVVEASKKSGSLITANYAIEQGREVWAIPGSIYAEKSEGTNNLIKDGANVLTSVEDILR